MKPIAHIRKSIFEMTQTSFALVAGATQGTVCRWERGELSPDREHMERIRAEAARLGKPWDDRWFFEVPPPVAEAAE